MKTVFVDVDTQLDFLLPSGALYVPGAEHRIAPIAKLNQYAAASSIPLISTMDAHSENDPEFAVWPPHCIAGTLGQRKPASTLVGSTVVIPARGSRPAIESAKQIVLEKVTTDCFTNPHLVALLDELGAERCVVYGVATEICVKNALFGLLRTGRKVEIAMHAVQGLDEQAAQRMLADFQAAGGGISTIVA